MTAAVSQASHPAIPLGSFAVNKTPDQTETRSHLAGTRDECVLTCSDPLEGNTRPRLSAGVFFVHPLRGIGP